MENKDLEWTEQERAEFSSLLGKTAPPAGLERQVIDRLAKAGLLARRRAPVAYRSWLVAAGLAVLLMGFGLGRWQPSLSNAGPATRYLLLMHEDGSFRPGPTPGAVRAEVGRWATRLERAGELIEADRLELDGLLLAPSGAATGLAPGDVIAGLFVLRATSDERALAIARSCPHLAYGGHIEVRRIAPDGRVGPI